MGAELSAEWRSHVLAVRGPALVAIGVQAAQLLLRPIPSEVSPLDQALSGDAVRHPDRGTQLLMHTMLLSILGAALPVALAFGLPLVATVLLRLPLRLSRSPPCPLARCPGGGMAVHRELQTPLPSCPLCRRTGTSCPR